MVLTLDQIVDDGNVYPSIEVSDAVFTLKMNDLIVNASGELPLYKSREFEKGVKKWMKREISQREKDFKIALQKSEREIMSSFAFKKEIGNDATAHSTLSETMQIDGDHVLIN